MKLKLFLKNHASLSLVLACLMIFSLFGTISVIQSQKYYYRIHRPAEQLSDISFESEGDKIVELSGIETNADETVLTLKSVQPGSGRIYVKYTITRGTYTNTITETTYVNVLKAGLIFVRRDGFDYAGFNTTYWGLTTIFGLAAFFFIWLRKEYQKDAYYSFRSIACCASILLFSILFLIYLAAGLSTLILPYVQTAKLLIVITKNLMLAYSLLTIPFVVVFAIALAISNVKLFRHEGKRLANMLGIGIAVALAVGTAVNVMLFFAAYRTHSVAFTVTYAVYSAGFAIFQVLLIGSIITCLQAAYHKVPYDKDYIIILGCAIRKDGTLFPLIRGRVDRAVDFWNKQYQATGKKAVFVPSGGQGDDEIIAEAKAMEQYLLEQGIPQELILAEDKSTTTHENMKFSKELIDASTENASIAYSTTNYHVFRSGLLAQEVGVKADGIGARTKWYFWPNAMIREVVGVFSRQSVSQWLFIIGLILLSGLAGYAYTLIY